MEKQIEEISDNHIYYINSQRGYVNAVSLFIGFSVFTVYIMNLTIPTTILVNLQNSLVSMPNHARTGRVLQIFLGLPAGFVVINVKQTRKSWQIGIIRD